MDRYIRYSKIFCVILLIFSSCTISCKNVRDKKNTQRELKEVIDDILGKKVFFPDTIQFYYSSSDYVLDSAKIFNSDYIILTYLDASCGNCIGDIKDWGTIVPLFRKYSVPVVLICGSDDDFAMFDYLCDLGKISFQYPFVLDINNKYLKNNEFMKLNEDFKTLLVNNHNEILLLGNPIRSKAIKDLYLKEIQGR